MGEDKSVVLGLITSKTAVLENKELLGLFNALKAKEDKRFEEHSGVDFKRTASAISQFEKNGGVGVPLCLQKMHFQLSNIQS